MHTPSLSHRCASGDLRLSHVVTAILGHRARPNDGRDSSEIMLPEQGCWTCLFWLGNDAAEGWCELTAKGEAKQAGKLQKKKKECEIFQVTRA